MVSAEQITTDSEGSFLRVTMTSGSCAWGNANIPLNIKQLKGKDGLVLKLRITPSTDIVSLALHTGLNDGNQRFYHADYEANSAWTELIIPWADFRDNKLAFNPENIKWASLQVCRSTSEKTHSTTVDIKRINTFTD